MDTNESVVWNKYKIDIIKWGVIGKEKLLEREAKFLKDPVGLYPNVIDSVPGATKGNGKTLSISTWGAGLYAELDDNPNRY